ncbi:MAG TPA: ferritin-like fold-containing protein [Actinomycetota bacterium]|nr:ferritin-like fold-containing protein [Actinomycetota bacterium]
MNDTARRDEAVIELIGALTYGLLHSFEAGSRAVTKAPTVELADRQASFAAEELERYRVLRARLNDLTDRPDEAFVAFRATLDAFYDEARADEWLESQVFHFIGDTITTDFAELLAPRVDTETADAVRRALTGRVAQEAFALQQITDAIAREGDAAQARVARFAGVMIGQAMNRLRDALLHSDALQLVIGDEDVKEIVLELLGRHRERLERLGLDTLGD